MGEACSLVWMALVGLFRSRASLAAEILVLRHQINVLRRNSPKRQTFSTADRLIFAGVYRLAPTVLNALAIVKPETVIKWHRAGFRSYWSWKSRRGGGRPTVPLEIRRLVGEVSIANPLSGAPRIHGELLKLGVDIGQTSVAKDMVGRRKPPSQGWRTFLRNHADGIAAMDMFVVPTISFRLLYGLLIMGHRRRHILWFGVTAHPTAEWIGTVDVPARFRKSKSVGAVFGLTCSKYQSGEIDWSGRISRCGDEMMRVMLYEAAQSMLRSKKWSWLKAWAMQIARRRGMKKAIVALARRLAVILHRIWVDGTEFRWTRKPQQHEGHIRSIR